METTDTNERGRPSDYDVLVAETICNRIVGGESLRAICADPVMPARATVFRWLTGNEEFRRSYALARESRAEELLDEILEIADDSSGDYVERVLPDGKVVMVPNPENIRHARLRIKARKWALARMTPRKYGNR
jgi:hypothetical protein